MNEKLERAKKVIKNNWKPFTVGVIFTTVTFVVTKRITMRYMSSNIVDMVTYIRPVSILSKQDITTNITKVYSSGRGRPGNLVGLVGRPDIVYGSQTKAARIFGVSNKTMSQHLDGKIPVLDGGYVLTRLGT
jgi:hypothetical protein